MDLIFIKLKSYFLRQNDTTTATPGNGSNHSLWPFSYNPLNFFKKIDIFDYNDIQEDQQFRKKIRSVGRIYPILLLITLAVYLMIAIFAVFMIILILLPNLKNVWNWTTQGLFALLIVCILGIIYSLWGIIAYSTGSIHHFKTFKMALVIMVSTDIIGLLFCFQYSIQYSIYKILNEIVILISFLFLKLFLHQKSLAIANIAQEQDYIKSLRLKQKV